MILAADWLVPVTSPPLHRHALLIEDDTIVEVRPAKASDPLLEGACILPGLVNAHTHLAYTNFRNFFDQLEFFPWIRRITEVKQAATEQQISESTRAGIRECLRAGITTVADLSDMEAGLRVLAESPLRGIYYWEIFGVEKNQAEESWNFLQSRFPALRNQYQSTRLQIGVSPHSCYTVRPELFERVAAWALMERVPVSFHLSESREEEEFISKRKGIISDFLKTRAADWVINAQTAASHLEKTGIFETHPLVAHSVQIMGTDLEIFARNDVAVAHCPKSNAKFGHGVAPLVELLQHNIRVGLGTDSAASNNRLDLFEEARFALLQQRAARAKMVLSEQQLLELMTIEGARAMGLGQQIGSLEIGKKADLIAVQMSDGYLEASEVLNFLIYTAAAKDVIKIILDGREVDPNF